MNTQTETQRKQKPRTLTTSLPSSFAHSSTSGPRVPGWEDCNIGELAKAIGMSGQHLRQILTGRNNTRLRTIEELSAALDMPVADLIERIRKARELDGQRLLNEMELLKAKLKSRMKAKARVNKIQAIK